MGDGSQAKYGVNDDLDDECKISFEHEDDNDSPKSSYHDKKYGTEVIIFSLD